VRVDHVTAYDRSGRLKRTAACHESDSSNLLKIHICHIREKLALSPNGKRGIKAVLGVGYSPSRG